MVGAKRIVRGHSDAHRTIHARKLLHRDHIFHIAKTGAAIFRGKDGPHHAHFAQFPDDLHGEVAGFVPLHYVRSNLALGKFPDRFFELQLLVIELEIQNISFAPAWAA